MQRFLRDLMLNPQVEQISLAYDERIAIIQKHFPPSMAAVYAIPRLGQDRCLEWWSTQQGQVRPFNELHPEQQQALLHAYAAHQSQLKNLASTLDASGMPSEASVIRSLITPAQPDSLYSVESRLLIANWYQVAPAPALMPAPTQRHSRRWIWLSGALLLALVLLLLLLGWWWFWGRGAAQIPVVTPAPDLPSVSEPAPDTHPVQASWPTELIFLVDNSSIMAQRIEQDSPLRLNLARHEIERIVASLPAHTDTHLLYAASGTCKAAPTHYGPYSSEQRSTLLNQLDAIGTRGPSPLAASLVAAAATIDGQDRDALIFAFVGGPDTCGEDICAAAQAIHEQKPKLRINLVDLSGQQSVDTCIATATNGMVYFWGTTDPEHAVDLAQEASNLLAQPGLPD